MSENNFVLEELSSDDLSGRYLTFCIGDKSYGVELMHVLDIISIQTVTRVPSTPHYVKGIINLRGKIVPVIDVRLKFSMEERAYDERTCIIVLNLNDMQVGLIVDQVSEVLNTDSAEISALPEFGSVNSSQFIQSIARSADKLVIILDCEKLLQGDITAPHF